MKEQDKTRDTTKFSQIMLVVNELDEKLDLLCDDLRSNLADQASQVRAQMEWLAKTMRMVLDEVSSLKQQHASGESILSKEWITTEEAAKYIGCKPGTICDYINHGYFSAKRQGRRYIIKTAEFLTYANGL